MRVWDAVSSRELWTLRGHLYGIARVALTADGSRLASCSPDNTVKIWDATSDPAVLSLAGHRDAISGVALSPDGHRVASASRDGTARVWDAESGRILLTLTGHKGPLTGVCFSPAGRLASAGVDLTVRIWDVPALVQGINKQPVILRGHEYDQIRMAFSADDKRLLAGSYTDGPRAVRNPEPLHPLRVWDAFTGQELAPLGVGHATSIYSVAASADGRWVASGGARVAKVWDARSDAAVLEIKAAEKSWGVLGLAFRPDGEWLASSTQDQAVRVWETETGREVFVLKGHRANALSLAFSGDGKRLASAAHSVKLWDTTTGQEVFSLPGTSRVAFSGDGKRLAACGPGNTVLVWSAAPLPHSSGTRLAPR